MVSSYLSQSSSPTLIRPQRSLGGLVFDIVVRETHEDTLVITEHPVEQGASISDHAYLKPATVSITGGVSDAGSSLDLSSSSSNSGNSRPVTFYEELLKLQSSCEPFEIVTGKRSYKNMLLETLSVTTEASTGTALTVTADCREVIIVQTRTTTVPPRARHASAKTGGVSDKGNKQLQTDKRSAISEATGGTGHRRPGGPASTGDAS